MVTRNLVVKSSLTSDIYVSAIMHKSKREPSDGFYLLVNLISVSSNKLFDS